VTLSFWRNIDRSGPDLDRGALQVTKNTRYGEQEWRPSKLRVAGSSPAAPTRSLFVSREWCFETARTMFSTPNAESEKEVTGTR
jgi:hypothetical protein